MGRTRCLPGGKEPENYTVGLGFIQKNQPRVPGQVGKSTTNPSANELHPSALITGCG